MYTRLKSWDLMLRKLYIPHRGKESPPTEMLDSSFSPTKDLKNPLINLIISGTHCMENKSAN